MTLSVWIKTSANLVNVSSKCKVKNKKIIIKKKLSEDITGGYLDVLTTYVHSDNERERAREREKER